jgi:hypothetical protein
VTVVDTVRGYALEFLSVAESVCVLERVQV